jgi:hypothetical protein
VLVVAAFASSVPVVAGSGKVVTRLPGFDGPLPFHLETGSVPRLLFLPAAAAALKLKISEPQLNASWQLIT